MARYPKLMIWMHWITFSVIAIGLIAVLLREFTDIKSQRLLLLNLHRSLEVWIPAVVLARLFVKVKYINNHPNHGFDWILELLIKIVHISFYIFLFIVPILGILQTQASGHDVSLIFFNIPTLIAPDMDLAETLDDYHELLAWLMVTLVGFHIIASLFHHFIIKDNVLKSMLPINWKK